MTTPQRGTVAVVAKPCDPVGEREIADRLRVKPGTVHMWKKRGVLPPPDWAISGVPAWNWPTIEKWATLNGYPRDPKNRGGRSVVMP